jgi:predicted Zn-dependent protease
MKVKLLVLSILFILLECASSPMGRKQVIIKDDAEMNAMGTEAFNEMKKTVPIETASNINNYVRCISFASLKHADDTTGVDAWEVVVFRDNNINAFALPGGKIGVYTGILAVANTADKLAAVIGHEIAHVTARHGNERVSQAIIAQGGLSIIQGMGYEAAAGALGVGAQYGVILPFSRKHESEADLLGIGIMAKAGFNPQASVQLWESMKALGGDKPPEFMSTHPSDDTRIKDLKAKLPEAMTEYTIAKNKGEKPNCKL